ncbi:MAG: response regulator transcription factor [Propionivibrio sp.]
MRDSWRAAFPDLVAGNLDGAPGGAGLVWLLLPRGTPAAELIGKLGAACAGRPLVLLADEPTQDDAVAALAAGAQGYCNGHAAPGVLRQVAMVVENGGIWVGQGLMQRLLSATARLLPASAGSAQAWRATLTPREQETGVLLAKGASNKEIARQLDITERTVKAHVGAMLEKLGARDRLQLSLIINGVERSR